MAVLLLNTPIFSLSPLHPSHPSVGSPHRRPVSLSAAPSSSSTPMEGRSKFEEFPHVSAQHRSLMLDLLSTLEDRLGPQLHPCALPPDVEYYENQGGTARGSLYVRRGHGSSPVIPCSSPSLLFISLHSTIKKPDKASPFTSS